MSRNLKFYAVMVVIVAAAFELLAWAFAALAMQTGALRFYPADIFSRLTEEQLARAAGSSPLGWPADDSPRSAPLSPGPVCGSAFGDSMTYGSDIADEETWVHLLSLRLGCKVVNDAVPAFGLDQAVLRYERLATEGKFVILGLFLEMVRRSVAASWTFYSPTPAMELQRAKPLFSLDGDSLRLHPIPKPLTRETLAAHHATDYYMRHVATKMAFPYSLKAVRAIYIRLVRTDDYRRNTEKYLDPAHPSGSGVLARRLIDRFAQVARARGARLAIVLIPAPGRLNDTIWDRQFADDLRRRGDACVIDLKPSLREHAGPLGGKVPVTPEGHYTAVGNRWIADAVADSLDRCGTRP